ncbi:homoserine kinase [Virgibacillus xinjiangensis]|uniref:Homoserine kinase n=1 Tax=Virgibacillus xinjiangensis TaxID=393090 RepID=A0ABV7CYW3_9BACI
MKNFRISIPATSANLGPAFDSAGIALDFYLTLEVRKAESWSIKNRSDFLPDHIPYKENIIYQVAERTANQYGRALPPCEITVFSDIPLARGFGSSASAVLAGIEVANQMCNLSLTKEQKLLLGTIEEGHPDNIAPALLGGFTVTAQIEKEQVKWTKLPVPVLDVVGYIPNFELKTEDARNVLPDSFTRQEAITASSVSNMMLSFFLTGDMRQAGDMMEQDLLHEPYRAKLLPLYPDIKQKARQFGAFGTVISGAGPSMISFAPEGTGLNIAGKMAEELPDYRVVHLKIDPDGLKVIEMKDVKEETAAE